MKDHPIMRKDMLPIMALILVAAFLRLYHLGTPPFWGDEDMAATTQYRTVGEIISERLERRPYINIEPPGYHIVNQVGVLLVPVSQEGFQTESGRFRLRLVSALVGVVSVLLLFGMTRRIAGSKDGWIPAALFAFSFMGFITVRRTGLIPLLSCSALPQRGFLLRRSWQFVAGLLCPTRFRWPSFAGSTTRPSWFL